MNKVVVVHQHFERTFAILTINKELNIKNL